MSETMHLSIGPHGSTDEQNIGFQGSHKEKHKIKWKHEGDIFMADYCCDNGFTCSFHFRSMPPPINHVRLKLSALWSRALGLFDTFPDGDFKL